MILEIEDIHELRRLVPAIRGYWEDSESAAKKGKVFCSEAVKGRILFGKAMNEAKGLLKHGKWLGWLQKNFQDISIRSIERAMSLANSKHVANLDKAQSLRQAYVACGILPETEALAIQDGEPEPEVCIERITKRVDWFRTRLSAEPVSHWSVDQRERMAMALRPIVELYQQLQASPPEGIFLKSIAQGG